MGSKNDLIPFQTLEATLALVWKTKRIFSRRDLKTNRSAQYVKIVKPNVKGDVMCSNCGKNIGQSDASRKEHEKLHEDFAKSAGLEWKVQKKGGRSKAGATRDYARNALKKAINRGHESILDQWQKDEKWRNSMIGNGFDEEQMKGMDALANAPKASEAKIAEHAWSKVYRDVKLKGYQQLRRTDKTGGSGTVAARDEPDYDEVRAKRPKAEASSDAGGDSGPARKKVWVVSNSTKYSQKSDASQSQKAERSSGSGGPQWQPKDWWQSRW
jgi:hypothetical protein